jgi:hypothetical protein
MPVFKFRESERETLLILLGDFYVLEPTHQPSDLLCRLKAAGMVEPVEDIEPLIAWGLTPVGKDVVRRALG